MVVVVNAAVDVEVGLGLTAAPHVRNGDGPAVEYQLPGVLAVEAHPRGSVHVVNGVLAYVSENDLS